MAKNDSGYSKPSSGGSSYGGWGREQSHKTFLKETTKKKFTDFYIRTRTRGILDPLGQEENEDLKMQIVNLAKEEIAGMTKAEIDKLWESVKDDNRQDGNQAYGAARNAEKLESASVLLEALYSATKEKERADLDDGELVDDPVNLIVDGQGWGDETKGRLEVRKHVNIAVDNSGSTHMPETGFCSRAMRTIAENLMGQLQTVGQTYPYLTYDAFSFNRITQQHTGYYGREVRKEVAFKYLQGIHVDDPLKRDAIKTNLAPLLEQMYNNEVRRNKIGEPRIDIILTDGEFESIRDLNKAVEWQRKRGPNVTTYVLNLVPEEMDNNLPLPHEFRIVPVNCIGVDGATTNPLLMGIDSTYSRVKEVDEQVLAQVLNRIVLQEVTSFN